MGRFARRLLAAAVTIFLVLSANFLLFRVLPGSAAVNMSHVPGGSPQLRESLEREFGLNKSLGHQYLAYLNQLLHGNLGVSFANQEPVSHLLVHDLGNTLLMTGLGFLGAVLLGVAGGVLAAWRRGGVTDRATTNVALAFYAVPSQFLGLVLVVLFGGLLPTQGATDPFALSESGWHEITDRLQHVALPALTFALVVYGQYTLLVRNSLLETMGEDYVLTARAIGLRPRRVLSRYALPNAILPVVTVAALQLGTLVGGSVLIETVFSWPGVGLELYNAVTQRDYPVMQGVFLVFTIAVVGCNFVVDSIYPRLDPRVRT